MGDFDKKEYDKRYQRQNIIQKHVTYNRLSETDMAQLDFMAGKNYSQYVKDLIWKDIIRNETEGGNDHGHRSEDHPAPPDGDGAG